ncbi:hypothetical protein JTE90_018129 [Oedothorax gibbosus]|uniref:Uncharacterized protein n=1 Tax=Oedothorax gibbosus TaxID=931172 RepID=A0AAV6UYG4_9ARAC|nr:hypothetical protein JTE90_018129 [Oedothorax gibbosus]
MQVLGNAGGKLVSKDLRPNKVNEIDFDLYTGAEDETHKVEGSLGAPHLSEQTIKKKSPNKTLADDYDPMMSHTCLLQHTRLSKVKTCLSGLD